MFRSVSRQASRSLRKRRIRTPGGGVLQFFAVIALAVGLLSMCDPTPANAAKPSPRVECGNDYDWSAIGRDPAGAPALAAAVEWAHEQVAPITGTTWNENGSADFVWEWQAPGDTVYRPGTYKAEAEVSGRQFWVHAIDANQTWTRPRLREHVLRMVIADHGVTAPTSTADGVTARDRKALKAECRVRGYSPDRADDDGGLGSMPGVSLPQPTIATWVVLIFFVLPPSLYIWKGDKFAAPALFAARRLFSPIGRASVPVARRVRQSFSPVDRLKVRVASLRDRARKRATSGADPSAASE